MLKNLFLISMLLCTVESNWDGDNSDPSATYLGFYAINMTCNDDATICQHCVHVHLDGRLFTFTTIYTADPYMFQYYFENGIKDWNFSLAQEDPDQMYRWCECADGMHGFDVARRVAVCVENTFSDISVPDNCPKPVALVTCDYHPSDGQVRGQQMLFCQS
ncbi:uncharacterized protein LOC110977453 [Acanthaster planci]|uniref:Uncharacterized protein LOC110977453 n=1 Tax=Acanthaster planci TaxID=133434 RepID=A0A8B7Y299_ACAPL|nr:uncharacterized protein LOC110977453 [Acanthaster planci]